MQTNQVPMDFSKLNHVENKISNQEHFERNREKFSKQCRVVYEALLRGEKLTSAEAFMKYNISYLPRRIKDLKDIWGVFIKDEFVQGKFKQYYL